MTDEFSAKTNQPPASPELWYYLNMEQVGPLGRHEIKFAITAANVANDTLVWSPVSQEWRRADKIKELDEHGGWSFRGPRKPSSLWRELALHVLLPILVGAYYWMVIVGGIGDTVSPIPSIDEMPRASDHDLTPVAIHGFFMLWILASPLLFLAPLYWAVKSARVLWAQVVLQKYGAMNHIVSLMSLSQDDVQELKKEVRRRRQANGQLVR